MSTDPIQQQKDVEFYAAAVTAWFNTSLKHSIRVNSQWRVCFVWTKDGPVDVEIVDYH
jgi:hypothetical protein